MMTDASDDTGLIVPVRLPPALEALRRQGVADSRFGLPAHATLLFPFAAPEALDGNLRARVEGIVSGHVAFRYRLTRRDAWPGTLYAAVEPELGFLSLFEDLAAAFPEYPLYRGAFPFAPHVTIVEGADAVAPEIIRHPAWASLPVTRVADSVDLIVREAGRWRTRARFALVPEAVACR